MNQNLAATGSANRKAGAGVDCTYRPVGPTCPISCALYARGCYAQRGVVPFAARRSAGRSDPLPGPRPGQTMRLNVSGDYARAGVDADRPALAELRRWGLAAAQVGARAWGYSHAWRELGAAGYGPDSFGPAVTLFASCDSPEDAAEARAAGWRTARVTRDGAIDSTERICPFDRAQVRGAAPRVTCSTCALCIGAPADPGRPNIAFDLT